MCKSMNALFCAFMDKEQESSFCLNDPPQMVYHSTKYQNYNPPTNIKELIIFENSSGEEFDESLKETVKKLRG